MLYCLGSQFDLEPKESAGKSTILEQLAMLPFFPRKRRCCTRLAIHVRLRRTPGISRATLTVLNGKGEEQHCREIPQENGWLVVQVGAWVDMVEPSGPFSKDLMLFMEDLNEPPKRNK